MTDPENGEISLGILLSEVSRHIAEALVALARLGPPSQYGITKQKLEEAEFWLWKDRNDFHE